MMMRKYKSLYRDAYAALSVSCGNPSDSKLLQKMMIGVFRIIMSDPNSIVEQGRMPNCVYTGYDPAFRLESIDGHIAKNRVKDQTVICGGRMRSADAQIPFGQKYVAMSVGFDGNIKCMKISMRRFLSNLKCIDSDLSISAYCALRGIDLKYEPK